MYASPVIYSTIKVPDYLRVFYFCNPLAGAIEAMRASLLGVQPLGMLPLGVPPDHGIIILHLLQGAVVSILGLLGGLWCFRRAEQVVADVA
jgi:lipopolysaccharide transport system permease protein